jgi:ADP-ribosylglycohydrolase/protein-tyrosine phosphatase
MAPIDRHPFTQRCVGSFLGLALGDAYGEPLEFLRGKALRRAVVDTTTLTWTDDTHMGIYLSEAIEEAGGVADLGEAWGAAVTRWLADPLMPSTAPGNTCLQAAHRLARGVPWTESGVRRSDGCGAVMRVAPLAMRWRGGDLTEAARVSAVTTHAHPNAPAAAQALCWLHRAVLERGTLDLSLVRHIAGRSRLFGHPEEVPSALQFAADWAEAQSSKRVVEALPEANMPTGDGGWRSVSCMGLAVAAVLAATCFEEAVELATRIDGDSDSVGAVAGMLAGALWHDDLPEEWLQHLPRVEVIRTLARRMAAGPDDGCRTSLTHPIRIDWVEARGRRFGITLAPGKQAKSAFGPPWRRDLGIDLAALKEAGCTRLVSLVEEDELAFLRIDDLEIEARRLDIEVCRFPMRDGAAPDPYAVRDAVKELLSVEGAVVHCRGGLGRAGTVAACALVTLGFEPDAAMAEVRRHRRHAIERVQEPLVHVCAKGWDKGGWPRGRGRMLRVGSARR